MNIQDCMKRDVVSIRVEATVGEAVMMFVGQHIGTLPVVDDRDHLVGLLQLRDLLALVMPDFVRLVENFDFVHDFGAVESRHPSPEAMARPVREVMQPPLSVEETCGLLRAFATLRQRDLHDLPVVTAAGTLVGIASRVDVATAILAGWQSGEASSR